MVGEEGIEFEYQFHGKSTHPPMKYLSESHLNSLGQGFALAPAASALIAMTSVDPGTTVPTTGMASDSATRKIALYA